MCAAVAWRVTDQQRPAAGHGGVSGRYNAWHQRAFELAWLLDVPPAQCLVVEDSLAGSRAALAAAWQAQMAQKAAP